MALYAVGDIHGHLIALKSLMNALEIEDHETIVFLGDYVDKGPDVAGTLDFLVELSSRENFIFLRGNHDQLFIDALLDKNAVKVWECLAGEDPLRSYGSGNTEDLISKIPSSHKDFLINRCKDFHETESYIFVHGGMRPHLSPEQEDIDHLHWLTLGQAQAHESGKTIVCGHSSQASGQIADLKHTICIDTGVTKGKSLTCLNITDFSYTQVSPKGQIHRGKLSARAGESAQS